MYLFKVLDFVPSNCDCFPCAGGRVLRQLPPFLPRCLWFVFHHLRLLPKLAAALAINPLFPVTCRSARPSPGMVPATICSNQEL